MQKISFSPPTHSRQDTHFAFNSAFWKIFFPWKGMSQKYFSNSLFRSFLLIFFPFPGGDPLRVEPSPRPPAPPRRPHVRPGGHARGQAIPHHGMHEGILRQPELRPQVSVTTGLKPDTTNTFKKSRNYLLQVRRPVANIFKELTIVLKDFAQNALKKINFRRFLPLRRLEKPQKSLLTWYT